MIQKKYTLTIATVCYNCKDEVAKLLSSILPLLNDEIEYLIIDGGSNDGTIEVLEVYQNVSHFRYISEQDSGIYNAMNKASKLARGEWLWFINCGDKILKVPDLKKIKNVSHICYAIETENGVVNPKYDFRLQLYNTLPHQGLFYHKTHFPTFDESYKIFSDYALNLDLWQKKINVIVSNEAVAFHSLNGISNEKIASKELTSLLKNKNSYILFLIAILRFKIIGFKQKIKKIFYD